MITQFAVEHSFQLLHLDYYPIKVPEGNIEYLLHMRKLEDGTFDKDYDLHIHQVVEDSHKAL